MCSLWHQIYMSDPGKGPFLISQCTVPSNSAHLKCICSSAILGTKNTSNHADHNIIDRVMWVQTVILMLLLIEIIGSP